MLLYSKARGCNEAGKLEASKVLAAAANGTSPADEGEILSSFRGKTVDFPRTRNYFLALAPPLFHPSFPCRYCRRINILRDARRYIAKRADTRVSKRVVFHIFEGRLFFLS